MSSEISKLAAFHKFSKIPYILALFLIGILFPCFNEEAKIILRQNKPENKIDTKANPENYKDKKITVYIEEPMPFSEDTDIKVDIYEKSIKEHEKKDRGIYVWKFKLDPNEKKEFKYKFRIIYPKDASVQQQAGRCIAGCASTALGSWLLLRLQYSQP